MVSAPWNRTGPPVARSTILILFAALLTIGSAVTQSGCTPNVTVTVSVGSGAALTLQAMTFSTTEPRLTNLVRVVFV